MRRELELRRIDCINCNAGCVLESHDAGVCDMSFPFCIIDKSRKIVWSRVKRDNGYEWVRGKPECIAYSHKVSRLTYLLCTGQEFDSDLKE